MMIGAGGHARQIRAEFGPNVNVIAIGDPKARHSEAIRSTFRDWDVLLSPRAVSFSGGFGPGTIIFAGAIIGPHVRIARHVIVGNNAVVSHDCVVQEFVTIGPGAVICGGAWIGKGAFIGANAVVTPEARVPDGKLVKAGERWSKK